MSTIGSNLSYRNAFTRRTVLLRNRQTLFCWKCARVLILMQHKESGNEAIDRYETQENAIKSNTSFDTTIYRMSAEEIRFRKSLCIRMRISSLTRKLDSKRNWCPGSNEQPGYSPQSSRSFEQSGFSDTSSCLSCWLLRIMLEHKSHSTDRCISAFVRARKPEKQEEEGEAKRFEIHEAVSILFYGSPFFFGSEATSSSNLALIPFHLKTRAYFTQFTTN